MLAAGCLQLWESVKHPRGVTGGELLFLTCTGGCAGGGCLPVRRAGFCVSLPDASRLKLATWSRWVGGRVGYFQQAHRRGTSSRDAGGRPEQPEPLCNRENHARVRRQPRPAFFFCASLCGAGVGGRLGSNSLPPVCALAADPAARAKPSTPSQPGILGSEQDAAALSDASLSSPTQSNLLGPALRGVHVCRRGSAPGFGRPSPPGCLACRSLIWCADAGLPPPLCWNWGEKRRKKERPSLFVREMPFSLHFWSL